VGKFTDADSDTVGALIRLLSHWHPDTRVRTVLSMEVDTNDEVPFELDPDTITLEITASRYHEDTLYLIVE
jgi:hypothetical protein